MICHDPNVAVMPFPGASLQQQQDDAADSHRKLTLLGSDIRGVWTNTPRYFEVGPILGVLECRHVWWLDVGGVIPHVPAGRWQAEILLKYRHTEPWKDIDWRVMVEESTDHTTTVEAAEAEEAEAVPTPPAAIHLRSGRERDVSFDTAPRGRWIRYRMGIISVPHNSSSGRHHQVRLSITGTESDSIHGFSFGGLELKSVSVGWKKEALLLRMLEKKREVPASSSSSVKKKHDDDCSASFGSDTSSLPNLPREVVARIAQYLISPLPHETLLLHKD